MTAHPQSVPWPTFAAQEPALAQAVQERFVEFRHHVLATLRRDGSPRVSGTEVQFKAGSLFVGMMHESRKATDLLREGRYGLHANPGDGTMRGGDAKVAGTASEVVDPDVLALYTEEVTPPEPFHVFELLVSEVVLTALHPDNDRLIITTWSPRGGLRQIERR